MGAVVCASREGFHIPFPGRKRKSVVSTSSSQKEPEASSSRIKDPPSSPERRSSKSRHPSGSKRKQEKDTKDEDPDVTQCPNDTKFMEEKIGGNEATATHEHCCDACRRACKQCETDEAIGDDSTPSKGTTIAEIPPRCCNQGVTVTDAEEPTSPPPVPVSQSRPNGAKLPREPTTAWVSEIHQRKEKHIRASLTDNPCGLCEFVAEGRHGRWDELEEDIQFMMDAIDRTSSFIDTLEEGGKGSNGSPRAMSLGIKVQRMRDGSRTIIIRDGWTAYHVKAGAQTLDAEESIPRICQEASVQNLNTCALSKWRRRIFTGTLDRACRKSFFFL